MGWLFFIVVFVFIGIAFVKAKKTTKKTIKFLSENIGKDLEDIIKEQDSVEKEYSYKAAGPLFTPAERSFLGVLDQAVGDRARVFGKVRVLDVIIPVLGLDKSSRSVALNKINRKHFDFVLCKPNDLSVICVIELDDKSHQKKSRQERDEFLLDTCVAAGIPMIQVPARAAYTISAVAEMFSGLLPGSVGVEVGSEVQAPLASVDNSDNCPKCSSSLVKRTVKKGEHAGKKILACSTYPACRFYSPLPENDEPKMA